MWRGRVRSRERSELSSELPAVLTQWFFKCDEFILKTLSTWTLSRKKGWSHKDVKLHCNDFSKNPSKSSQKFNLIDQNWPLNLGTHSHQELEGNFKQFKFVQKTILHLTPLYHFVVTHEALVMKKNKHGWTAEKLIFFSPFSPLSANHSVTVHKCSVHVRTKYFSFHLPWFG